MSIHKTEAIILKTYDFRETSKIVVFFSRDFGKIKGLLKGARTEPQKFGGFLGHLSFGEIIFYKKKNSELNLVTQFDLKENLKPLKTDLRVFTLSCYITELLDYLMPIEEKNIEIFNLTLDALKNLRDLKDADKVFHIFIIKLLLLSGFRPHLDSCLICDSKIKESAKFNFRRGGLVCLRCAATDNYPVKSILKGTIATIEHIEDSNWQMSLRLGISPKIREELNNVLTNFLNFHLEKVPFSSKLLRE